MICAKCRFENPVAFAYCGRCGSPLTLDTPPPAAINQPPTHAERRQLSVMFCDMVGSTPLSIQLDPEELRDLTSEYNAICAEVIQAWDGRIAQFQGDGVLACFGYPQSHEDDALRAVRAALEIVAALPRAAKPLVKRLQVRVAIHTGLVVVGSPESVANPDQIVITGETPNVAARLQSLAEPGRVVISRATYRLVEGFFVCRSLGAPTLKGVDAPIEVFEVVAPSGISTRFEKALAAGLTPFVGRDAETAQLIELWRRSADGAGQVAMIIGEAGIGKSRLVQVLKERTVDEAKWELGCRCSPYFQNSTLYPAAEFLHRSLDFKSDDDAQVRFSKLEQALARFELDPIVTAPVLAALLGLPLPDRHAAPALSPSRQRQKTFEAIVAWLMQCAAQGPLRLVVEDLHWADPSTLELLDVLIERIPSARLMLILVFRPEYASPWPAQQYINEVRLARLPRAASELMINAASGAVKLPAEIIGEIAAKTDGVPLFIEELTQMVLESDLGPATSAAGLRSTRPLAIPSTLYDSLMARLDRLGSVKEVAQLAATIGKEFSYDLLRAISPLEETRLSGALNRLVDAGLAEQAANRIPLQFRFRHALIRDAAYDSLLRSRRRHYHRLVAEVLPQVSAAEVAERPELLAHHLTEAGQIPQAIPYWQQAGQRALERSANREAIQHLTKGLELIATAEATPPHLQQELLLCMMLAASVMAVKGYASVEAERVLARARRLCERLGENPIAFQVFWGLWVLHAARAERVKAREAAEQCLRLASAAQDTGLLLQAHHALGVSLLLLGEFADGLKHVEAGAAIYDRRLHAPLAYIYGQDAGVACLSYQGWAKWFLGYPDQARRLTERALELAAELGHPFSSAAAANIASWVYQFLRDHDAAKAQAEAAINFSTDGEFAFWRAMGVVSKGWIVAASGQNAEGLAIIQDGVNAARTTGGEVLMPYFLTRQAEVHCRGGRFEQALALLDEAQATLTACDEQWWQAALYRIRAEVLLAKGSENDNEAEAYLRKAYELAERQSAQSLKLRAATSLARLMARQGKAEDANALLRKSYDWFSEGDETADLTEARSLLGGS